MAGRAFLSCASECFMLCSEQEPDSVAGLLGETSAFQQKSRFSPLFWHCQRTLETIIFSLIHQPLFSQKRGTVSGKEFIALLSSSCTKYGGDPNFLAKGSVEH